MNTLDIITRAMRRIGIVAGAQLPRDQEQADALETLKAVYRRLLSEGTLGSIEEVAPTAPTYAAHPNQRVTPVDPDCVVTLPTTARHGAPICVVDCYRNQTDEYLFDARSQTWTTIDDLDLSSPAPLATADPNGLACYLALELADEYGQNPSQLTLANALRWQTALVNDWSGEDRSMPGRYF